MDKYLVILESPGKIKKVSSILGSDYIVMATMGHFQKIADEGKYKLGFSTDEWVEKFEIEKSKSENMKQIKSIAKKVKYVYLASDGDREGEAIAQYTSDYLKLPASKIKRVIFNEITEKAVKEGIKNAGKIDTYLVNSARSRAMLDKALGYRLSYTVSHLGFKSAGRVQSAALQITADREEEIQKFKEKTYFEIELKILKNRKEYIAKYKGTEKKRKKSFDNREEAELIIKDCDKDFIVKNKTTKSRTVSPKAIFTTSTFQQEVSNKLNYNPKKAMKIAQELYEMGLITYMRTDSTRISDEFIAEAKPHIEKEYPGLYYGSRINKSDKGAQNAHEGIRPTHAIKDITECSLTSEQKRVYDLIYKRTMASLMNDCIMEDTSIVISNGDHLFGCTGSLPKVLGYKALYEEYNEDEENQKIPDVKIGEILKKKDLYSVEKKTSPPSRYSEATLIKEMEKVGIGRPSTYAPTITTLFDRGYIERDKKMIVTTEKGINLSKLLKKYFSDVINLTYTAEMENKLDEIAEGKIDYKEQLNEFWDFFNPKVLEANKDIIKNKPKVELEVLDEKCPKCGSNLVVRYNSKNQPFKACPRFPKCRYTASMDDTKKKTTEEDKTDIVCPKCGKGYLIKRKGKDGKYFYGCTNYVNGCKNVMSEINFMNTYGKKNNYTEISTDKD